MISRKHVSIMLTVIGIITINITAHMHANTQAQKNLNESVHEAQSKLSKEKKKIAHEKKQAIEQLITTFATAKKNATAKKKEKIKSEENQAMANLTATATAAKEAAEKRYEDARKQAENVFVDTIKNQKMKELSPKTPEKLTTAPTPAPTPAVAPCRYPHVSK